MYLLYIHVSSPWMACCRMCNLGGMIFLKIYKSILFRLLASADSDIHKWLYLFNFAFILICRGKARASRQLGEHMVVWWGNSGLTWVIHCICYQDIRWIWDELLLVILKTSLIVHILSWLNIGVMDQEVETVINKSRHTVVFCAAQEASGRHTASILTRKN